MPRPAAPRSSAPARARQAASAAVTAFCSSAMPSCWLSMRATVSATSAGAAAATPARAGGPRPGGDGAAARSAARRVGHHRGAVEEISRCDAADEGRYLVGLAPNRVVDDQHVAGVDAGGGEAVMPRSCRRREGNEQGSELAGAGVDQSVDVPAERLQREVRPAGVRDSHTASVAVSTSQPGGSRPRSATACTRRRQSALRCCSAAARARRSGRRRPRRPRRRPGGPLARTATCARARTKASMVACADGCARAAVKSARSVRGTSSSSPARTRSTRASSSAALLPWA